jgi:predicted RNase H-like HicB family nuclease
MEREYTAVFKKSGSWIVAWLEEVPGVNTQGRTLKEARENLKDAAKMIFSLNRAVSKSKGAGLTREPIRIGALS